jgi:hypothetical protein
MHPVTSTVLWPSKEQRNNSILTWFKIHITYQLDLFFSKHYTLPSIVQKKKRHPCNRPCTLIELWDVEAPTLSSQFTEDRKEVGLRAGRASPPGRVLVLISVRAKSTSRPQCYRKIRSNVKIQWNHRESNPQPFRLVAQCLNQLYYLRP